MIEKLRNLQLNKRQQDLLFYLSLVMLGLFAFLFVGSREPVLFDDSGTYMTIETTEGVVPVYPVFLLLNQFLFGSARYLQAVVAEQAILAVVCVLLFVKVIKDNFSLPCWEGYVVFGLALLPFTTDLPQAMSTQEILTEGLAYALFYLFMIALLKAVWTCRPVWFAATFLMTLVLALVRSQMQILFGVCGLLLFYCVLRGGRTKAASQSENAVPKGQAAAKKKHGAASLAGRIAAGAAGCVLIMLFGILLVSSLTSGYKNMIRSHGAFYVFSLKTQQPEEYEIYLRAQQAGNTASQELTTSAGGTDWETASEEQLITRSFSPSQYVSLIFSRGIYEADRQDAALFEDELLQELFVELYEAVDAEEQRYVYAQPGLWMWKDIVDGIGMAGKTCLAVPSEYYIAYHPEIIRSDGFSDIRNEHLRTIGITLLKAHFGRFLYHTLMLLPSAFICTVFFQIAPIYGLCHLVTLFLYVTAIALTIWGYRDKSVDNRYAEFMAAVLVTNVVMVVMISVVFFGQQRYLVYNFGIFYVAYGLLAERFFIYGQKGFGHNPRLQ
jgi:hypothetical protein